MNQTERIKQLHERIKAELAVMSRRPPQQISRQTRKNPALLLATNPSRPNPRGEGRKVPLGSSRRELPRRDPSEFEGDPEFKAAYQAYIDFHGVPPEEVIEVEVAEGSPKFIWCLGQSPDVTYQPPKSSPKGQDKRPFLHEFTTPPFLAANAEGSWLGYVGMGGSYRIKPEGIVG